MNPQAAPQSDGVLQRLSVSGRVLLGKMKHQQQSAITEAQPEDMNRRFDKERQVHLWLVYPQSEVIDTDGDEEQRSRFGNHLPGIPGEGNQLLKRPQVHQCQKKLAGKHPAQVSPDAEPGNAKKDKTDAQQKRGSILYKCGSGSSKPI